MYLVVSKKVRSHGYFILVVKNLNSIFDYGNANFKSFSRVFNKHSLRKRIYWCNLLKRVAHFAS